MIKIGIYKIEDPDGLIYIGQSKDLDRRIRSYKNMKSRNQTKLKHSIDKYGWEFHKIEIIEFCNVSNRIWISAKECAIENKISVSHFCSMLNGGKKNKTSFKYLNE